MKFLTELSDQNVETLVEQTATGKKYMLEGIWASADVPNRNGRIYPRQCMESALGKYNESYVSQKRALGELNHPANPTVNLDRASHIIESLKMDSNGYVQGRAKVMETPMGIIVKSLIDEGVKLGVSTRGLGSLKESNGTKIVQNDFFISAIDVVSDPSGHQCYVKGMMEGVEFEMLADGTIQQLVIDHAKKQIDETKFLKEFDRFMKLLKG